jgi:hypothetical protein
LLGEKQAVLRIGKEQADVANALGFARIDSRLDDRNLTH